MADLDFQPGDAIVAHRRAPYFYPNDFYDVPASEGWVILEVDDAWKRQGAKGRFR